MLIKFAYYLLTGNGKLILWSQLMRIKFTAGRIASFSCPPGKASDFLWDTELTGFGIKASPGGSKQYILQSRLKSGEPIRITIGKLNAWSIDDARAEARRLQGLIDQGRDPRQQKAEIAANDKAAIENAKIEEMRKTITVQMAWDEYIEQHANTWGKHHLLDHQKTSQKGGVPKKRGGGVTSQGALYPILQMSMVDIHAEVLSSWQRQEAHIRPTSARHAFVLFKTFWNWASQNKKYMSFIDVEAAADREVRRQVPTSKTKKYDMLQRAQLSDWFKAVCGLNNVVISAYLQGLLITGARREELAELKWEHVDFKLGSMWIKDKVDDEGRMIPLTPYLAALMLTLPRINQWVFSSPTAKEGKIAEPRKAHNFALEKAGLEHVTLHGLRRTFASLAEWVEMPTGVVAQIMGHAPNATAEKHYKSRPLELLAIWHTKYEAWILEQANVKFEPYTRRIQLRSAILVVMRPSAKILQKRLNEVFYS